MFTFLKKKDVIISCCLALFSFVVFSVTRIPNPTHFNHYVRLSEQLLKGKIELENPPEYLEISYEETTGKKYVAYPPFPSILLMPFVSLNVADRDQTFYTIMFACLNSALIYWVILRLYSSRRIALTVSLLLMFGTSYWYLATEGSSWYLSHIIAILCLLLSLAFLNIRKIDHQLTFTHTPKLWFASGFSLGAAYFTRDGTILAAILVLGLPIVRYGVNKKMLVGWWRPLLCFMLGILFWLIISFGYNYARFNTILPVQHHKIPHMLELPIFKDGFLSPTYIPRNIVYFFTKAPLPYEQFPFYKPSVEGMAYLLVSPFLIFLPLAKWNKYITLAGFTGVLMLVPGLMNGSVGFSQFGYRYAMEATIMFMIVFASFLQRRIWWISLPAIILAPMISYWGIYFIRTLQIYGW